MLGLTIACFVGLSGSTVRASVASDGTEGNRNSGEARVSADGRYVVFTSQASNLVAGAANGVDDVFRHDLLTGETIRVSVRDSGLEARARSWGPAVSADGSVVAFVSEAKALVANDTNGAPDVFVRDLTTNHTLRVSVDEDGAESPLGGYSPTISADGTRVAFITASPLVANDGNTKFDAYGRDRVAGTTARASESESGGDPDAECTTAVLSPDGSRCAFQTFATNVAGTDVNGRMDVYVRTLGGGSVRASLAADGSEPDYDSFDAAMSFDGRLVAFVSLADDLVANDLNNSYDIFVKDLSTGAIEIVSVDSSGASVTYSSFVPSI